MTAVRAFGITVIAATLLGATACASGGTAATPTTPAVPTTTTAPATSPGGSYMAEARSDALAACQAWAKGVLQNAVDQSTTVKQAANLAGKASSLDVHWATEAQDMTFVSSLPETGNTPADIAQSTADQQELTTTCATLGVTIPN